MKLGFSLVNCSNVDKKVKEIQKNKRENVTQMRQFVEDLDSLKTKTFGG